MNIEVCPGSGQHEWDDFVQGNAQCWHYHLFGWKTVIEEAYGHECPYLFVRNERGMESILPLAVVKSRLFGHSVTSLPFVDTAGVIAHSDPARDALVAEAIRLAGDRKTSYLELRQSQQVPGDFRVDTYKRSLDMSLRATVEEQWQASPPERRNRVRKAQKAGLRAEFVGVNRIADFYRVWSHNMRDLGSPAHSRRWFELVLDVFAAHASLLLIGNGNDYAGAALLIEYKRALAVPWVSSLRSSFHQYPNDLLYWEAIKHGIEKGCARFDFGRSSVETGNHTYKVRWGAASVPLFWQYHMLGKGRPELPTKENLKYRLAMRVWQRLPLSLANFLGPRVRKGITN